MPILDAMYKWGKDYMELINIDKTAIKESFEVLYVK